ncbi:RNA polymerase II subunit B1 CTD phosphatase RTR1 KNAG_0G01540 [Huiozyma naganishii CBS 8797]|uniref:RNA polymerase II subunit B1 CTD phosphatase RPAP2 homolog n=1 Tax=Huiozyma naganishii (strain ATCC MYA-139 / BCRC 22969 / CBS 8797 / KCTC 17520 / NBRC 10181 / NCYC 3082 / Yp74L-3) TaxID=1071383 RepID=J7S0Y1_HUIN7|nr:hypothetical protein KNAG_0G01540 [Kazachstania naganishii CBS 8797]CCK71212.1 hypothetical protein KNAG_0G01540 [Kazachstania naganishii CBS 8797]
MLEGKISIHRIQQVALSGFQKHRQLSIKESEVITLEIITLLCDASLESEEAAKYLGKLITPETYDDLIDERNLNGLCGYPLCSNSTERRRDPFSMNQTTKLFMSENNPYNYLSKFCGKLHSNCSQFYQLQLSDDPLFTRVGIHLIEDTMKNVEQEEKYGITLLEEVIRRESTEDEIKFIISGIKQLDIKTKKSENGDTPTPDELSKWLQEITIVENINPSIPGDLSK